MELLRDLVKEQGIVSIIEDYKTEMELYEHKQKFKHSLKEIDDITYYTKCLRFNFSQRTIKKKETFTMFDDLLYFKQLNIFKITSKGKIQFTESNFDFRTKEIPRYKYSKTKRTFKFIKC